MQLPFLWGIYRLEIICADTMRLINSLTNAQVRMRNINYKNDLAVELDVPIGEFHSLLALAEKQGGKITVLKRKGLVNFFATVVKRPILTLFFVTLFLAACYLPSRILFISVEGNAAIPTNEILEAVENCGIRFGTSRRSIRSEVVKNALLQKIPELQWAGVNTVGCTAIISVEEKTVTSEQQSTGQGVSSIVAIRDGVIQSCTVRKGNPLCTVGQAVKAGQTLVSGYINSGLLIRGTQADAEISALTVRDLEVVAPKANSVRTDKTGVSHRYSVKIGKKLINFCKDSGNLYTECVKIYSERYLTLPGGFRLPICVITETVYYYDVATDASVNLPDGQWLEQFAKDYLQSQMIAGQVMTQVTNTEPIDDAYYLYGKYACLELIGASRYEELIPKDDRND